MDRESVKKRRIEWSDQIRSDDDGIGIEKEAHTHTHNTYIQYSTDDATKDKRQT
jgi:hypothetical protein